MYVGGSGNDSIKPSNAKPSDADEVSGRFVATHSNSSQKVKSLKILAPVVLVVRLALVRRL